MPTSRKHVAVNMEPESREAIRQLMYRLSSETGTRITISVTVVVACDIAMRHIDETIDAKTIGE
jgi:hypothetical protein